jgi:hypothetical protein
MALSAAAWILFTLRGSSEVIMWFDEPSHPCGLPPACHIPKDGKALEGR